MVQFGCRTNCQPLPLPNKGLRGPDSIRLMGSPINVNPRFSFLEDGSGPADASAMIPAIRPVRA